MLSTVAGRVRPVVALATMALAMHAITASSASLTDQSTSATITGVVTVRQGAVALPGAAVRVVDAHGDTLAAVVSDNAGRFRIVRLPAGRHVITVLLEGFRTLERVIEITVGETIDVKLELDLAGFNETVIVAPANVQGIPMSPPPGASATLAAASFEELPMARDGLDAAVATMAGVVQAPRGLSIRGGRPTQSGLQIDDATVVDASTGKAVLRLPVDAVGSVEVLPNPYAVEFGRFSSGVTVIRTRPGSDRWRFRLNNFIPSLRLKRGALATVTGIERFGPQLLFSGPLVRDRLFLSESAEYRYAALDVPSRPQDELKTMHSFNTFTRLDAHVSPSHVLTASIHAYPQTRSAVNMNTFTPADVAVDETQTIWRVILSDSVLFSEDTQLSSMFQVSRSTVDVGDANETTGLQIRPQGNQGRFFNAQTRTSTSYQWIQSVSRFVKHPLGDHFFKVGLDVLHASFDGASRSAPVSIRRLDGTLARRLTFSGPAAQRVRSTDVAVFAQDRWRVPGGRALLEAGIRVDRDGLLDRTNLTWRAGAVLAVNQAGTRMLRGGVGVFYERTPSIVGAFDQFEVATDERYDTDGASLLGPPVARPHRVRGALRTPRYTVWSLGYDHQFAGGRFVRVGYLDRTGVDELVVQPTVTAKGAELALSSTGRSRYRDVEVGAGMTVGTWLGISASYIRSFSRADLNAYVTFFDAIREPVISTNEYAPADSDAPHRLVARARIAPGSRWLANTTVQYRTGFPYTAVNEDLDVVLPRNRLRMPDLTLVDILVERRFSILGLRPWIGVGAYNALNEFRPTDVQRNVTAQDFGGFYNSRPRQIRLQLRFQ